MTPETAALPLAEWESFYVIIGSSAAALTGLMFVVIAVVADAGPRSATPLGIGAFVTPTIVHFCAALVISATLSAPWPRILPVQFALGTCAVVGFIWSLQVLRDIRKITTYTMVLEDWAWHIVLPLLAYCVTLVAALLLAADTLLSLFLVGGATALLVLIGIHNAWDTVAHLTLQRVKRELEKTGE
jgi:hypothetical protein